MAEKKKAEAYAAQGCLHGGSDIFLLVRQRGSHGSLMKREVGFIPLMSMRIIDFFGEDLPM